jgi:uncharacterized protein involved in response to NO
LIVVEVSMSQQLPPISVTSVKKNSSAEVLQGWPVLRLGFRPFYLAAALFACLAVPFWIAFLRGGVSLGSELPPLLWHAHEMLYGFAAAVIIGFLFTAVKAWTGLPTPRGLWLGCWVLLWVAARLAAVLAPYWVYALLDLVLLPVVAGLLLRLLIASGNRRNIPLIVLLLLMAVANLFFHLSVMGVISVSAFAALHAELALVLMVIVVMAGRVIPAFTRSALPGLVIDLSSRFERAVIAVTGVTLFVWVVSLPGLVISITALASAVLHAVRWWKWHPQRTRGRPILWILHASYAWMPVGFVLLAMAQPGWLPVSLAIHAFGVGVVGGIIIGMITRTARGHTGRHLQVSRLEVMSYALVLGAAVVRVLMPLLLPGLYDRILEMAALMWSAGFALYLWVYVPWLTNTRLDGKDG